MQASNNIINLDILPNNAQLTLKELASSPSKNKCGYTRLSESHIRRLEAAGLFPKSRQITGKGDCAALGRSRYRPRLERIAKQWRDG